MADGNEREKSLFDEIESLHQKIEALERCEENRRRTEETFLDLFNATEEVALLMDRKGIILVANKNAGSLYGLPAEELPGTSLYSLIPADRVESSKQKVETVVKTRKPVRFEGRLEGKIFENSLYPVLKDEAEVERIAIYVRDITERKRLQEILNQTEENYRKIYENAIEGIFQVGPDGHFISANPSLAQIHGYDSSKDFIRNVKDVSRMYLNPQDHLRLITLLFEQGAVQNYEVKMVRKDGTPHWISMNVRAVRDVQGKPRYYEGTMMDVTNRKMVEEALAESEERYRTAIEHSNDAVAIIRGNRIQYINKRFVEIFGYDKPDDLIGKPVSLFVHPDDQDYVIGINKKRQRGEPVPSRYEFKGIQKSGGIVDIEVSATSIVYRGTPVYLVYLRDISQRKIAEVVLRNERNRFRTLSESAPFGIILIDTEGTFKYINPKFKELLGYDLDELPNSRKWFRKAFPDSGLRKEVISTWLDYLGSTKPGEKVPRTLPTTCKDGTKKIIHFIPVRLTTGEYIVTLEDITERIEAHNALLKSHQELEQLNRAKTKAVNHISHELGTPLAVIQGNIRLFKRKLKRLPVDANLQNLTETLERNLARLFDIVGETDKIFRVSQELEAGVLLDTLDSFWQRIEDLSDIPPDVRQHRDGLRSWLSQYLSGSTESFQSINFFPFVLDQLEKVRQLSKHRKIRFQVEGKADLFVHIDPLLLRNVVEGLLRNAVENTPDGGTIRLKVEQNQGKIKLHVTDEGVGITEKNQAYIFDGLFHTKETEIYGSKKPYDFGAGGKGLDLLRMKVYGQRFGFDLSMTSKRCVHIPTDSDQCPGDISQCPHVSSEEECASSGGTRFTIAFQPRKASTRA